MIDITVNVKPAGNLCNIRCKYCETQHDSFGLTHFNCEAFGTAVANLRENYDHCSFILHGGEPLLAGPDLLENILRTCKKYYGDFCRFQVQTNGILLTEGISEILSKHGCSFSISLDPPIGDERYDIETRSAVIDNIRSLLNRGYDIGIISVAHQKNADAFLPFLSWFIHEGIPYWTINRIRCSHTSPLYLSEAHYNRILMNCMKAWLEDGLYHKVKIQPLMDLLIPGVNYQCRYSSLPDKCNNFFIYDEGKLVRRCEHWKPLTYLTCATCECYDFCGGGCPSEEHGPEYCDARKDLYHNIRKIQVTLEKE